MLDPNLKTQLEGYLARLVQPIELASSLDDGDASRELAGLLDEIAALSDKITVVRRDDDALKALEPTIVKMRDAAIQGKLPSAEDEKRVADANQAADTRAAEARKKATLDLLAETIASFTADQKAEVQRQSDALFGGKRVPRAFVNNPSKAPKDQVEALALSAYIERVLLIDRAIPLMEKMRAAAAP